MQKNPITLEGAASAQNPLPPVPTTKILTISHFMGTPMTPYFRTDGKGVVFIVNASTPEEAKNSVSCVRY
jgi:hypothetical protein